MYNSIVRLKGIKITNFKNVNSGYLSFENKRNKSNASILGLYGQNGSGKTAMIEALYALKCILSNRPIPGIFTDYINVDAEYAGLEFEFEIADKDSNTDYYVTYSFNMRKEAKETDSAIDEIGASEYRICIYNEVLSYSSVCDGEKKSKQKLIDTNTNEVFVPKKRLESIFGKKSDTLTNLLVDKKLCEATSASFVFSKQLFNAIRRRIEYNNSDGLLHLEIVERMLRYGMYELFVINTATSSLVTTNVLPLTFKYDDNETLSVGSLLLKLNGPSDIPVKQFELVNRVIDNMNIVLKQVIPGLTVGVKRLGEKLGKDGGTLVTIQLVSNKNSKEIPLQYESEGIKKIVSILQLLIVVYNNPSMTVAIDELDSGVFEYLLGEILRIISEKGKGQLIFTSHNLRPLETIDKGYIAFTTTNPDKRYIRMTNVKTNNNLRDFYYRDIILGEQDEPIYEQTNNAEIALAFRKAGAYNAT